MVFMNYKIPFVGALMSKKLLTMALKFLVSVFLIWFLLFNIDLGAAIEKLVDVKKEMLAAAMLVVLVQAIICGLRWEVVLAAIGKPLGFLKAFQLALIGSFFNQTLPSAVGGDAVRMFKAYRYGLGLRGAVNGVVLERVVTVVALVVLVDAIQPWFVPRVDDAMKTMIIPGLILVTLGTIVGLVFLMLLDRLPGALQRWRLVRGLGNLGIDARRLFFSGYFPRAMVWGFMSHINLSFGVFLLAIGLSLDLIWLDCLVLMPPVILVMTLPISIAGWGVREAAMVAFFGLIGVSPEDAVVLSILFGLTCIAASLPGGLIWLATRDKGEGMDFRTPKIETPESTSAKDGAPDEHTQHLKSRQL